MKRISRLLVAMVLTLTAGFTVANAAKEEKIPLDKVSANVLEAARKAVPGIKLTNEVEVEKDRKGMVYEFKGTLEGKEYEIEVLADGKVLKIDQEKDDGKDDDKDDKDDKEDNDDED